ncbi:hypothetical protein [[Acholeplasma] multilocale]|uniref:hypothetical protein n=1 Tax=[Acholeplasma] multilocale TaxID=264638 RepID=UPI000478EA70|nr:hypothetical protein [[Acholeplasma] multilocale]
MFFKNNNNLGKRITLKSFEDGQWINNFWVLNDLVYFTDSDFDSEKNLLSHINIKDLKENIELKVTGNNRFLSSPNPLKNTMIGISETEVKLDFMFDGFVYSVNNYEEDIIVSVIYQNEVVNFIKSGDGFEKTQLFSNKLIVKNTGGFLLLKDIKTRFSTIITKDKTLDLDYEIDNIILVGENIVVVGKNFAKLYQGEELVDLYLSENEFTVCGFNSNTIIISDSNIRETFYFNVEKRQRSATILYNNYLYRLECYIDNLIIGKPLLDNDGDINYYLPVVFIY